LDTLMQQERSALDGARIRPRDYSKNRLIALARRRGGMAASTRPHADEGVRIDDALDEVFRIAREADIPAEISHLKVSGGQSWGRIPACSRGSIRRGPPDSHHS